MSNKRASLLAAGLALVAGLLLVSPAGDGVQAAEESGAISLSLTRAQEIALENNDDLKLARLAVENAKVALREAEDAADDLPADSVTSYTGNPLLGAAGAVTKYVTPVQKANELGAAERALQDAENGIRLQVEAMYYTLLEAAETVKNKEAALGRAKENLRLAQARQEAGTAAQVEVLAQELAVNSAETELEAARNNHQKALLDFNRLLGLPLETQVEPTDEFTFEPLDVALGEFLDQELKGNSSLLNASDALKLARVNLEQAGRFYTPNVYTYRKAAFGVQQAEAAQQRAETQLEVAVRKAYLDLSSAAAAYPLANKGLELARERERLVRLQYEVGLATSLDLTGAEDALAEAEAGVLTAIHRYNLAKTPFKYRLFTTGAGSAAGSGAATGGGQPAGLASPGMAAATPGPDLTMIGPAEEVRP